MVVVAAPAEKYGEGVQESESALGVRHCDSWWTVTFVLWLPLRVMITIFKLK